MKAIVLEIRDGEAAVLREDGVVVRTRATARVGETIEVEESVSVIEKSKERPKGRRKTPLPRMAVRIAALAAAALLAFTGIGTYQYTTVQAAGCVSMDDGYGLSVDYIMNRRGQVIEIDPYGNEASRITEEMEKNGFTRCSLSEAIEITGQNFERAAGTEAATENSGSGTAADGTETDGQDETDVQGALMFSVTAPNQKQQERLTREVEKWIKESFPDLAENKRPEILEGSMEDHRKAREEGIGTAAFLRSRIEKKQEPAPAQENNRPASGEKDSRQSPGSSRSNEEKGSDKAIRLEQEPVFEQKEAAGKASPVNEAGDGQKSQPPGGDPSGSGKENSEELSGSVKNGKEDAEESGYAPDERLREEESSGGGKEDAEESGYAPDERSREEEPSGSGKEDAEESGYAPDEGSRKEEPSGGGKEDVEKSGHAPDERFRKEEPSGSRQEETSPSEPR